MGLIGMAVAQAFHAMGSHIVYHDPAPRDVDLARKIDARALDLAGLLRESDIVTLHVPLLPSTRSLIGSDELAQMKSSAILINAARGGIVDEAALAARLASGALAGAVVDVYSSEPPENDNPLFIMEKKARSRALLTPHIAGVTRQSWAFLFSSAWHNVEQVLVHGKAPGYRVA
jgi:phosphoglycerate dehydrogenase-like enzyme